MNRLREMQRETESDSITEVIRRAIAVYDYALDTHRTGGRLAVLNDNDEIVTEVALLP